MITTRQNINYKNGFTLVEISVAVAILGVALSIFVSLQAKLIDNFIYEKNLFRATLAAQYLMTFVEIQESQKNPPENGELQSDLVEALKAKGYFIESGFDNPEDQFRGWKFEQKVSAVELGIPLLEDAIREVVLTVHWSDSEKDQVTLTYFAYTGKELLPAIT